MILAPLYRKREAPLSRLHNPMDDLFDGFFRGLDRPFPGGKTWPALDLAEQDEALVVRAEIPGCDPEEIDISVSGNTLTISGQKKETKEEKDKGYYHIESVSGAFRREVSLPTDVDNGKVEATYENGVLSIRLPKAEISKAVKVQIKN